MELIYSSIKEFEDTYNTNYGLMVCLMRGLIVRNCENYV